MLDRDSGLRYLDVSLSYCNVAWTVDLSNAKKRHTEAPGRIDNLYSMRRVALYFVF